jgi:hypothetical protein
MLNEDAWIMGALFRRFQTYFSHIIAVTFIVLVAET